jgi:hypothetical protein
MPRATVSMEPETAHLRTCPGGFIKLRRMTFGELTTSQDMAYQVQMKASEADPDSPEASLSVSRMAIMEYQFKTVILEHNLEDETGRTLDFRSAKDVHLLDGNVGQEITSIVDNMHNWQKQFPNSDVSSLNGSSEVSDPPGVAEVKKTSAPGPSALPTGS